MKLLFVTQNEAPFRMKWMDELAKYMEVTVYHCGEYENNINMKYISYHTKNAYTQNIGYTIFGKKLFKLIKILRHKHDILLLDGYGFLAQQLLIIYLNILGRRYGMTIDGGFIPSKENKFKYWFKKYLMKSSCFIFSTSNNTDKYIIHYGVSKDKIYRHFFSSVEGKDILSSTISKEEKKLVRNKLDIDDKFTLISVGKLIPIKGYDLLLSAIKKIDFDLQLIIVGSNGDNEIVKILKKEKKIKIINFLEKKELDKYYLASDVFVFASRGDVWGLVVGEAMAKGLPIITTDRCLAGKAMIENSINGYIVPSEDSDSLKEAIENIFTDNLEIYSKNNLEKIKFWSIEESTKNDIENLNKIYKRLDV